MRDLRRGPVEECPKENPHSALEDELDYLQKKLASLLAKGYSEQGTATSPIYRIVTSIGFLNFWSR